MLNNDQSNVHCLHLTASDFPPYLYLYSGPARTHLIRCAENCAETTNQFSTLTTQHKLDSTHILNEEWNEVMSKLNDYKFCLSDRGLLRTFLFVVVVRVSEDES